MSLTPTKIRNKMFKLKPLLENTSVEQQRKGQSMIGELMEFKHRKDVMIKEHSFENFLGAWVMPKEERRHGVLLYLHGGGFVCGDLKYAKGVASTLSVMCGVRTFCISYRLAPENPFPAAVEDALEAYKYLLKKGYSPENICLCGESAGGGLCYSLCARLKEENLQLPCGIIAISPWVDLTSSGESYINNAENDPSLSKGMIDLFRSLYAKNLADPLVSPLFLDLQGMPPSIIFAAQEEILLSDSQSLNAKLQQNGNICKLFVKAERWHAYLLYGFKEDDDDYAKINQFLNKVMSPEKKLRWLRLDNAAKIYPAARSQTWSNVFRVSISLKEPIDKAVLQSALDVTVRRFPSICVRLRRGTFWYYLEQLPQAPRVRDENSYPITRMSNREMRKCAFRVIVYKNRIAVEFFHALTDGTGGLIFLKTLAAEYIQQMYGTSVPADNGVLGRLEEPLPKELEDSFQKYAGPVQASRKETDAFHVVGTPEANGVLNITCFKIPVKDILDEAHKLNVSLTVYLASAIMLALQNIQARECPNRKKRKAVKALLPVNLRKIFKSESLRNFALYTIPEIDPRHGDYDFEEICKIVNLWMNLDITPKKMAAKIATNIFSEHILIVRLMPLFIKNLIMKAVYKAVGERKSSLSVSNLGNIAVPEEMKPYIERFDFVLGVQATTSNNCGVLSFGDTLYVNFIRDIKEPKLEMEFFKVLQKRGLSLEVESNHV